MEQQTFSGDERVKPDSYHVGFGCGCAHTLTNVHTVCMWKGEREKRVVHTKYFL